MTLKCIASSPIDLAHLLCQLCYNAAFAMELWVPQTSVLVKQTILFIIALEYLFHTTCSNIVRTINGYTFLSEQRGTWPENSCSLQGLHGKRIVHGRWYHFQHSVFNHQKHHRVGCVAICFSFYWERRANMGLATARSSCWTNCGTVNPLSSGQNDIVMAHFIARGYLAALALEKLNSAETCFGIVDACHHYGVINMLMEENDNQHGFR